MLANRRSSFFPWLGQCHEMITWSELLAGAEVRAALARTVLLEDTIDASEHQSTQQKVRRVERIAE